MIRVPLDNEIPHAQMIPLALHLTVDLDEHGEINTLFRACDFEGERVHICGGQHQRKDFSLGIDQVADSLEDVM